jgi:hypothetical protein
MASPKKNLHSQKVADILKRYPDPFLACRDMGHNWKPDSAAWLPGGDVERVLVCTVCESRRKQILDRNGYIVTGTYAYEKGYTFTGLGRMDRDDKALMRRTNILRLFAK